LKLIKHAIHLRRRFHRGSILVAFVCCLVSFQNCNGFKVASVPLTTELGSSSVLSLQALGINCTDPSVSAPSDTHRLSRLELMNTLKGLFGASVYAQVDNILMTLPNDEIARGPQYFPVDFSQDQLVTLDNLSSQLKTIVQTDQTNLQAVAGNCAGDASVTTTCAKDFIRNFGKRAFRHPLTADDVSFFYDIYTSAGANQEGLGSVISAILLSPEFLYHIETGTAGGSDTAFSLSNYEIASRIAYQTTDSPPDTTLMALADDGTLSQPAVLDAQVSRLLLSTSGRDKIHRFFSYWLMLANFQGLPTAPAFLDGINKDGLDTEMTRELSTFIDYIVFVKKGSYKELLTSSRSFAKSAALAQIYGQSRVVSSDSEVADGDRDHSGILLRTPFLASTGTVETHPILRGVSMRRRVLCDEIPSPSAKDLAARAAGMFVPDPIHFGTAEMTGQQTNSTSCMGCHSQINPVGFVFEGYDNLGRRRTTEKMFNGSGTIIANHAVTTTGRIRISDEESVDASDAADFIGAVATGAKGPACFSRQVFRYFQAVPEKAENGCVLSKIYGAVKVGESANILDGIKAAILNDTTRKRFVK
jgi:hypothetical protein